MIHLVLGVKLKEQENSPLVAVIIHISLTALTTFYIRMSHSHFLLPFQNSGSGRDNWVGIKQAKIKALLKFSAIPELLFSATFQYELDPKLLGNNEKKKKWALEPTLKKVWNDYSSWAIFAVLPPLNSVRHNSSFFKTYAHLTMQITNILPNSSKRITFWFHAVFTYMISLGFVVS